MIAYDIRAITSAGEQGMTKNEGQGADHHLSLEIARLRSRMDDLAKRLEALEAPKLPDAHGHRESSLPSLESTILLPNEEGLWTWLGRNAVLPRLAAVCFMLVVALLLRTVTDNAWVSPNLGTILGLSYVAILLCCGWWQYASSRRLAPVFSSCGLLLLFSIIAESRFHFSVLPLWLGSSLLIAASAAAVSVALRYRALVLLWLAVMGAVLVIFILDFPNIAFPAAALILLMGGLAAIKAAERALSTNLRWPVLFTVFFLFSIWGFKLSHAIKNNESGTAVSSLPPAVFAFWFLPLLLCFVFLFSGITSRRILKNTQLDAFDHLLPLAGASLLLLGGNVVLVTWGKNPLFMGVVAWVFALLFLGVIWHKIKKQGPGKNMAGFVSLGVAAALLLFFSVPFLVGNLPTAQIFLPLIFVAFLALSQRLGSGNMRLLAVFLAFLALMSGLISGVYLGPSPSGPVNWLAALSASITGLGVYFWCRRNPPPKNGFFLHIDPNDYAALTFLACGLLSLYFLTALALTSLCDSYSFSPSSLACGKSILINIGAAFLIVWGTMIRKTKEIAATGIIIAFIGGGKVFFSDLLHTQGLPLILSVSSFGALTALCSLVLSNWQKMCGRQR
ncbi:MAG: hypothetical protein A2505_00970 [Deltaproteobacteria bacterium RIFOXYD12_FULL_55_16]|nr:MAG: hypothetical protein A2505_00970 [Deltaproteobacteria bacterium RIFOXYD12_FULL_55_16]